jgi:hypothetical protein
MQILQKQNRVMNDQRMLGWVEMGASSAGFLRVNFCHASLAALARRLISERSVWAFCVFVGMWTSGAVGSAEARGLGSV